MQLQLGVKADPILYRYSYEWLFGLMQDEGVTNVQIGSFFELYHLPDGYFLRLRDLADRFGIRIRSLFTSHRELGGFFQEDADWVAVAFRNYERFIKVGALMGVDYVGSNPGSVLRDRMDDKMRGISRYLQYMKVLQAYAHAQGLKGLAMEPMSCLAEPPTLPGELEAMVFALAIHHNEHRGDTVPVGFCVDVSHGYVDADGAVRHDNMELLEVALPHIFELHLKNTDSQFNATFGFSDADRARGVVDIPAVARVLHENASRLSVTELVGYLEIGGPKLGRDYSDFMLERQLRDSLAYLRETFC